jgi:hypothetical protein
MTGLTLILAFGGCNGTSTGDTGTTDSGSTDQTDTGGGTTDTTPPDPEVSVSWTGVAGTQDAGSVTLGLVRISDSGAGSLAVGDTLAVATAGEASARFTLPIEAPAEHWVEHAEHPGLMVATYVASAWIDAGVDGILDDGTDAVVGADSDAMVVFLGGTIPDGWPAGWSLADNHFEDGDAAGDPSFSDLGAGTDVVGLGLIDVDLPLGGTYQGGDDTGLAGIAVDEDGEPDLDDLVFDTLLLGSTFDASQSAAPHPDFQFWSADAGARVAIVGAITYSDGDGNGHYDWLFDLDADSHTMCFEGEPVGLFFLGQSTSLASIVGLDIIGWQAGWMAVTGNPDAGEDLTRLSDTQSQALAIGPACTL